MRCRQCGSEIPAGARHCPACGSALSEESRPSEHTEGGKLPARQWIVRSALVVVLVGGIGFFLNQLLRTYHPIIEKQPTVAMVSVYGETQVRSTLIQAAIADGFVTVPLLAVREHRLVRFFDPEKVQEVPMIAYITPQGKLVTAMSKSEQCGSTDFYLSGNNIHCASCPSYWNMASLEAYACCQKFFPDPFPSAIVGEQIRIDPAVVRSWKSRL